MGSLHPLNHGWGVRQKSSARFKARMSARFGGARLGQRPVADADERKAFVLIAKEPRLGWFRLNTAKSSCCTDGSLAALLPSALLLAIISISIEIKLRSQGGNRVLNVLEKGISFQAVTRPSVRWSKVVAFWFEEIPGEPQLRKITVEFFGDRRTKFPRRCSLALDRRGQCPALLAELNLLQQQHNLKFQIELDRPMPVRPPPRHPVLGLSLSLAGMLFLLAGVPLLLVSLGHHKGEPHHSDASEDWSPEQREKLGQFVKAHFSTAAEFHRFTTETGAALTAIGVGLVASGILVQRQRPGAKASDRACG
jgi:hypothetical protein